MATESDLIAALRRHGLSDDVARAVIATGERLWSRTEAASVEFAAMLDADTGESVGHDVRGEARRTDINPQLAQLAPGHRYIHLHTHPAGTPLSAQDLALHNMERQLTLLTVIAAGDVWYLLSGTYPESRSAPSSIILAYDDALASLAPRYRRAVRSGRMSRQRANQEGRHAAVEIVANRFGLRYDRIRRRSR